MNLSAKIWFRAQGRRVVALFIVLFSRKFAVVAWWNSPEKIMQSQHIPGHIAFVVSLTNVHKLDKLIRHLEHIRRDMVHKSKHHDGVTVRNNKKQIR
ncbi:MAG: hypothetical protein RIC30_09495 [Marinoscillum sp.]|uniref:hypothetical protein n=1 Tax=Marinoscillum sp. TaxID=2024838 RepID=UPI0032F2BE0E